MVARTAIAAPTWGEEAFPGCRAEIGGVGSVADETEGAMASRKENRRHPKTRAVMAYILRVIRGRLNINGFSGFKCQGRTARIIRCSA